MLRRKSMRMFVVYIEIRAVFNIIMYGVLYKTYMKYMTHLYTYRHYIYRNNFSFLVPIYITPYYNLF